MENNNGKPTDESVSLKKRIEELEAAGKSSLESKELAESIIDAVREPLIIMDPQLKIISVSKSFYDTFKTKSADTIGQFIYDLGNRQWDIPKLRKLLEDILPSGPTLDGYEIEHDFVDIGKRIMVLNARRIPRPPAKPKIILLAIEDITDLKRTAELIKANLDLKRFTDICVGRELDMVELKRQIDSLLTRLNEKTKYNY